MSFKITNPTPDRSAGIIGCLGVIFIGLLLTVLWGFLVSFLWNETMPYIFGLPEISFAQGVFLTILASILVRGGSTINTGSK